jgi:hypothetical protein
MIARLTCFLLCFNCSVISIAQVVFAPPEDSSRLSIHAVRVDLPVKVDGKLDDPAWSNIPSVSDFLEIWPSQLKDAKYPTAVKVLYNQKSIFIGAFCAHPRGRKGLRVQDMRRDFNYAFSEWFAIAIDPFKDMRNPIPVLSVTPYATQLDQLSYEDRIIDTNWDAIWKSRTTILDSGWVAEIEIPFATLRYPKDSNQWRINFIRLIRNESQMSAWSPIPRAFGFGRTSYAGFLDSISPPKKNLNLRLQPYGLLNVSTVNGSSQKIEPKFGGEIKWGITSNTVLEASLNTDFAQADVDRQVINLKRSSIFFPERRQFFLENANLFSVGVDGVLQPFFTRTVGRDPNGGALRINEGIRLIHQNSKKAIGVIFIDQEGDSLQAESRIGIGRTQFNVSNNSRMGAMAVIRRDNAFEEVASNINAVAVLDGFVRAKQSFYLRPMISLSRNSAEDKTGYAGSFELNYTKNTVVASLTETWVDNRYDPKTGFLARTDFVNSLPSVLLNFNIQKYGKNLLFYRPGITGDFFHIASTQKLTEASLSITPIAFVFKGYHRVAFTILPSRQKLFSTFEPVPSLSISPGDIDTRDIRSAMTGTLVHHIAYHSTGAPAITITAICNPISFQFALYRFHTWPVH